MNNKKHIIGLEQFRDILQICPKIGNKKFVDPPLESEIIIFLASLGHTGDIRKLSDSSRSLSSSNLVGMYNKKNIDYAYLLWEDFIFKIETKSSKKGSAMYYPRFTKIVRQLVMEKILIPRRNKVNWHYARDDPMFTTIQCYIPGMKPLILRAILPVALTNEDIRNSESYKESRLETHSSHASGSGADEGTGINTMGFLVPPDYDSYDDKTGVKHDGFQDDEQEQDDDEQ
ncbi:hypothetical protein Tco_0079459 [Tanacetum coccineum]